jgi:hypothetical protein
MKELTREALIMMQFQMAIIAVFTYIYAYCLTEEDFGQEMTLTDSFYFTCITSCSVGFGDITPKTPRARRIVTLHALTVFLVFIPIIQSRVLV